MRAGALVIAEAASRPPASMCIALFLRLSVPSGRCDSIDLMDWPEPKTEPGVAGSQARWGPSDDLIGT